MVCLDLYLNKPMSMKSELQKNDLLLFLELFRELNGLPCDFADNPDLVISTAERQLGVEHTRLYREEPESPSGRQLRPQERIHFQITQRAFELFRSQVSTELYLTVEFAEPYDYRTRDVPSIAADLSNAVITSLMFNPASRVQGQHAHVEAWRFQRLGFHFPSGINSFHYMAVEPDRGFELWAPAYGYMVPHLSVNDVNLVIQRKDELIDNY